MHITFTRAALKEFYVCVFLTSMGLVKATGERTLGESEPDTNAPSTNFQKWTAHLHWSTITWSILCETSIVYLLVRTTHDGTIFGCGLWMNNRAIMWSRVRHHVTGLLTRVSLWKCIFLATRGEPHDRFPSFFFSLLELSSSAPMKDVVPETFFYLFTWRPT